MAPPPMHDSAVSSCFHGCLAFLHRHFPPQSPPSSPLSWSRPSQQKPSPWDCSTIPKLAPGCCTFQETCIPVWVMYSCGKDCLILIPFRLPQISCFTISLKCVSSDSDDCPPRAGPVLLTLLFFSLIPSSYRVLHGSIYSFPLVRYSCLLSAGVLHALLCLKMYS